ncbi:MAG: GNAT family N-acetyltransferase [Lachnospiraceae bacterium]|nr:GNAT family N-acetyltransferase [Lachnospiraceae bacterium]
MMEYRKIQLDEMKRSIFDSFKRHQKVTTCRRKIDGEWKLVKDEFIDEWNQEEYAFLVECLRNTIKQGGVVYGAFSDGILKGFCSVEGEFIGSKKQYLDLTSIHVSEDARGKGIGRTLFSLAASWAKEHGGKKLYISAHSAIESQMFYEAMGCVEAEEYQAEHVEMEPCDCQLEYVLSGSDGNHC